MSAPDFSTRQFIFSIVPAWLLLLLMAGSIGASTSLAQKPLIRINAGSSDEVTSNGVTFVGDTYFSASTIGLPSTSPIAGTQNDVLYQTERLSNDELEPFSYNIPVPQNGSYTVLLHFAETAFDEAGDRVFDIIVEGITAFDDYDIIARATASNTAWVESISNIPVSDGILNIEFVAVVERAKISGIEVFGAASDIDVPYLYNVGGAAYTNPLGTWLADDGSRFLEGTSFSVDAPIAGTTDDELYESERFGNDVDALRFVLPGLTEGTYTIDLHFSENFHTEAAARIFDVAIEGQTVLDDFDIFATAGGGNIALVESFPDVSVTDGILNVTLLPTTGSTTINAISITSAVRVATEDERQVPGEYTLTPAYPNPFNPTTQFSLYLSRSQDVSISVFNILGQEVISVHRGVLPADRKHLFTVDASDLPSGMYLIQVNGEQFVESRKVVLLK